MADQHSTDYLRTGAPAPYNGRRVPEEEAQSSLNKIPNGQQNQKSYREKVIAIARVWNEARL
jgi:hypothetical protein